MNDTHIKGKVIGVYGSATTPRGTPEYDEALHIGRLIAEAGGAVLTGGYGGTMGAVSQGAAEAGGRVIGVTVGLFRERGLVPNPFLHEEIHLPTLAERLNYVIVKPEAYVVLKGGVGTLAELALAWSLMPVREIPARPLLLVGPQWRQFYHHFAEFSSISTHDLKYVTLVDTPDEVVPALESWWANPPNIPARLGDVQKTPPLGDPSDEPELKS